MALFNFISELPAQQESKNDIILNDFFSLFAKGQYEKALLNLDKIEESKINKNNPDLIYWKAIALARNQKYDLASTYFNQLLNTNLHKNYNDFFYEYGQTLYAKNELSHARDMFNESIYFKFKTATSKYYIAHISQILEEFKKAKDYYILVLKDREADKKLQQVANFQLGETLLALIRDHSEKSEALNESVNKLVIPFYHKSIGIDPDSSVALQVQKRLQEIMSEFELDPNLLSNKRRIDPKRYNINLSQELRFDDNVTLASAENSQYPIEKSSLILETTASTQYQFVLRKKFLIIPNARFNLQEYLKSNDPEIFQNNSLTYNIGIKNKYEHLYHEAPSSFIIDMDYSSISKDYNQIKKREFYASSFVYTLGRNFQHFKIGDTTIKFKIKDYTGKNESINNHTYSINLSQNFFFNIKHLLIFLVELNFIDNYNNKTSSNNNLLTRLDYLILEIMPKFLLSTSFSSTFTDTKELRASKGIELLLNATLELSKELTKYSKIGFKYGINKNTSKDVSNRYLKHEIGAEVSLNF